jgi:hypothetical protein
MIIDIYIKETINPERVKLCWELLGDSTEKIIDELNETLAA